MATAAVDGQAIQERDAQEFEFISAEVYMEHYAAHFYEWVDGKVIKMTPVMANHDSITAYLRHLFDAYFTLNPIGQARSAPFVMLLEAIPAHREPDLQIILNDNSGQFTESAMIGPADICIEVVSNESISRDHGKKYEEYEKAGVREYWIVDPIHLECRFYRLNEKGIYETQSVIEYYETPLLPKLRIVPTTFWQDPLPDVVSVVKSVRKMVE